MGHAVIFQYSIGLPSTDDPMIGEKPIFEYSKLDQKENCLQLTYKEIQRGEDQHP